MDALPKRLRALGFAVTTAALLGCGGPLDGSPSSGAARADRSAGCAPGQAGPLVATVVDRPEATAGSGGSGSAGLVVVLAFPPAAAVKTGIADLDRAWCPDLTDALPTIEQSARAVLATKTTAELSTIEGRERAEREIRDRVEGVTRRRVAVAVHEAGGPAAPIGVRSRGRREAVRDDG